MKPVAVVLQDRVFAAAVILPPKFYHPLLNDSKQVLEKDRYKLRKVIERKAIAFAVGCGGQ
jgi:ribonuclease HII